MEWVVIGAASVVVLIIIVALAGGNNAFQSAASELGIKYSRTSPEQLPRLKGMIDGLPVTVELISQQENAVRYIVYYPSLGISLRMERETTISRTMSQLGSTDQEIGAEEFDSTFKVNTSRPDALRKMMTPPLQRHLVDLVSHYPGVVIGDGEITYTAQVELEPATLVSTLRDLVAAGSALNAARPPALETPPVRRRAPAVPHTTPPPPDPIDMGEKPKPTVSESNQVLHPEREAPPAPPPPPPTIPQPEEQGTGLPEGFFADVFATNRMSYEDDERFEAETRGATVRLTGSVRQAFRYENRDDLDPPTGVKLTVTVAEIDTDLYGKTGIDAVICVAAAPDMERGDQVSFTGQIEGIDAFMRTIDIGGARLT